MLLLTCVGVQKPGEELAALTEAYRDEDATIRLTAHEVSVPRGELSTVD